MSHPRLASRRNDTDPKCATCGWWSGGALSAGLCGLHTIKTLDLHACTAWRDGDFEQEVIGPDGDDYE